MGVLDGKTALICGLANSDSLAWGITQALHAEGARLGFSYPEGPIEKRLRPLAEGLGAELIHPCNVTSDEQIEALFAKIAETFGTIDILVHAIAFAERQDLAGRFVDTSRAGFLTAHNISAYSLVALARGAMPLMPNGGSILTLTYYGSEKVVSRYNVMGVAKASLEASLRYLAYDLGQERIRVNAISSGPTRTSSASGIRGFKDFLRSFVESAPLHTPVTTFDIGQAALFFCSDASRLVTGQVLYVDSGYSSMAGMPIPEES